MSRSVCSLFVRVFTNSECTHLIFCFVQLCMLMALVALMAGAMVYMFNNFAERKRILTKTLKKRT